MLVRHYRYTLKSTNDYYFRVTSKLKPMIGSMLEIDRTAQAAVAQINDLS